MINSSKNYSCCGCAACIQACPKQCIAFYQDNEGFFYPQVEMSHCIDCGLCEKVCPYLHNGDSNTQSQALAAKNQNEKIRIQSSSGGIFSILAEQTIIDGGVVFGARFSDDWSVIHDYTEKIDGLAAFRGSKYVQSNIGNVFQKVRSFLKDGRKVLFSGTPCQIAGLKLFLHREDPNLVCVECVCHGVPSPLFWRKYLEEQTKKDKRQVDDIVEINFRDKSTGWRNYSFLIKYNDGLCRSMPHDDNPWIRAMIHNINLRPSCYNCKFKIYNSYADITLGDLWGAEMIIPGGSDDMGLSLVISHTQKGDELLKNIPVDIRKIDIQEAIKYNKAVVESPSVNKRMDEFWAEADKGFIKTIQRLTKEPFILRCKMAVAKMLHYYK